MKRLLQIVLALYVVSLVASIAGLEIFSGLLTLLAILGAYQAHRKPADTNFKFINLGPDLAIFVFVAVIVAGAFLIENLPAGMSVTIIREVRWVITLYVLTAVVTHLSEYQPRLLLFLAGLTIVISLYTYVQVTTGFDFFRDSSNKSAVYGGKEIWRAWGLFTNTMTYSYVMGILLCFLFAGAMTGYYTGRNKTIILASIVLLSLSLFLTFTRGAWLAAGFSILVMYFLKSWRLGLKVLGAMAIVIGVMSAVSEPVRERLYSIYQEKETSRSVSQRWDLWHANWAMFKDHPLLGMGYGQNKEFVQEYHRRLLGRDGFVANAHNNVLQILAGAGVFAFLAWLYFCAYFFISAVRLWLRHRNLNDWPRLVALGSIGAQIYFHFGGVTQATFFDKEPMHMFLFFWAILISQIYLESVSNKTNNTAGQSGGEAARDFN